jgi:hypothetical protein
MQYQFFSNWFVAMNVADVFDFGFTRNVTVW